MITSAEELLRELRTQNYLGAEDNGSVGNADERDLAAARVERPWYIGLLLGGCGWFAGIFLLVFVFMLFKPDSGASALVTGFVLLFAAWGLFMVDRDGAF